MTERPWLELAGHAALDPVHQARVGRWLAELFGDDLDTPDDTDAPPVH